MHEATVAAYVGDATFAPTDDETLAPYVAPWLGAEGQEAFYRQIVQNDARYTDEVQPLYARIERPVMIIWGEEDRLIPLEKGEQLHEAIPGSQLKTIPRCAHLALEDAPETVVGTSPTSSPYKGGCRRPNGRMSGKMTADLVARSANPAVRKPIFR